MFWSDVHWDAQSKLKILMDKNTIILRSIWTSLFECVYVFCIEDIFLKK